MEQGEMMEWMMQIESAAEEILADRQHIVNLDRQRQDARQALRALHRDKSSEKAWLCFGNLFVKLPIPQAKTVLQKDFNKLDAQIVEVRQQLRTKVNKLRDLEQKEELKGFELTALTQQEKQALEDVL